MNSSENTAGRLSVIRTYFLFLLLLAGKRLGAGPKNQRPPHASNMPKRSLKIG